ncbi:MAG TPA: DUF1800 domain-containing protein [Candidatus Acidoferrales bacterium]|nr:DUF1800 domain-containing protein [Candidatus Acidoferrales bacterium]
MKIKSTWKLSAVLLVASGLHAAGAIIVTPPHESTAVNGARQYTAAVSGLSNPAVTWSLQGSGAGNYGTVDASGLYHAPATLPANGNIVTITATSMMDPTVKGSATGTIKEAGPTITTLSPTTAQWGANFTLIVNGTGFKPGALIWVNGVQYASTVKTATQVQAAVAFWTNGQLAVVVVNPGTMFSNALPLTITAASTGGGGGGTGGGGTGGGGGSLTVAPASVNVAQGLTQQFTASLNGAAATVTWSATAGSISAAGLFTAPAQLPSPPTVTITATTAAALKATATATILSNVPPAITSVGTNPIPVGVFTISVNGTGFAPGAQATLGGSALAASYVSPQLLTVSGFASQSGSANLVVSNGAIGSQPFPVQVGVANPLVSASAARRFLQQAAFGPTPTDAAHVQQVGFQGWLTEQFNMPQVSNYQVVGAQSQGGMPQHFLTNAVMQPDQLRQKVAFALSQIFVVSLTKAIWNTTEAPYQEMLMADAFTNYRKILGDVTLSPAMGQYLDMANNGKGNAAGTVLPNENYAREILQLFSVGLWQLNTDGTIVMDAGNNRTPSYSQKIIPELARVFTGWTYLPNSPNAPVSWGAFINPGAPLQPYPAEHDTGAKTLLAGAVIPAGLTIQADLNAALDNIFNHPNTGPFIVSMLIQHLVKSNPSPAYVQRVATVFNNPANRGDMQAVIAAILTDTEARQNDAGNMQLANDGHLQEPALFIAGLVRAFGGTMNDQNYFGWDLYQMTQDLYNAPSVFNYYSPGYVIPQSGGLLGPEFQIYTPYTALWRGDMIGGMFTQWSNPVVGYGPGTTVDLTPFLSLAGSPGTLVDALDYTLTSGTMPSAMKQTLTTAVANETGGNLLKVETAVYLILTSGYYNVWH